MLVLDSGGFSQAVEPVEGWVGADPIVRAADLWPPIVPSMVLLESLQGHAGRDVNANRFGKSCIVDTVVPEATARRAAELRRRARTGSAVDALVVAVAEPGGTVLTGDRADIEALSSHARQVSVVLV